MKWVALLLVLFAVVAFGQARWSASRGGRVAFVALGFASVLVACVVAASPGPAVVVGGLGVLVAARAGTTSRQAVIGLCGIVLVFAGAFLIRAAG